MSIRIIRTEGDTILRKVSKEVTELTDNLKLLISDMKETMNDSNGVGIAAVQVGVLRRIIIVEDTETNEQKVFINPVILEESSEHEIDTEGCLSVPGMKGKVDRALKIKVKAKNENMEDVEFEANGLFAREIQHEVDHLDGILYIDKVEEGTFTEVEEGEEEEVTND